MVKEHSVLFHSIFSFDLNEEEEETKDENYCKSFYTLWPRPRAPASLAIEYRHMWHWQSEKERRTKQEEKNEQNNQQQEMARK